MVVLVGGLPPRKHPLVDQSQLAERGGPVAVRWQSRQRFDVEWPLARRLRPSRRKVEVAAALERPHASGQDADERVVAAVEAQKRSDDVRPAAQMFGPE